MSVNEQTLNRIAHLSRLEFRDGELERMKRDFSRMVDFVQQLRRVDTAGIEPLTTMSHEVNSLRPDGVSGELPADQVFRNAPDSDGSYFRVPKVLP